ncbi:9-O-acetylesterase [Antarcticibacterium sp. 1MA-6-2]|uniref:sialate O-acetylesterase n=1 Tax=Antarcticibacterium sp. 1MA-6-2 TaxID=2908210 RepID=UPI001F1BD21C|nr:sialate O-acetylesterase [Antarcticibacterium sp. 1MA-6-2]UJH90631.1 9-O-acetylesterase [Antarcticibacterium sp. 1MA-6-2]
MKNTNFKEMDSSWIKEAEIRLLKILPETDYQPQKESRNLGWQTLSDENIANFSAVAYHFGKSIYKETGVPLGIISANLGATTIETWMSNEALSKFPQFQTKDRKSFKELREQFKEGTANWSEDQYYEGEGLQQQWYKGSNQPASGWKPIEVAGNTWENVEDLKDYDGAVWFRKSFDLPDNFTGDSLTLQLSQIDDHDITWVNNIKVGETFGRHNHRNYKVAVSNLKKNKNLLVVRVFDAGGIGGFTTNAFWGNEILWGTWEYYRGKAVEATEFTSPELANVSPFSSPAVLFNGTIAPLLELGIKGVIWYQGESNELRAYEYRSLFPALIKDWRKQFDQGPFPFLFVQLANYREETQEPNESLWAELREAQELALKEENTGMAVAIDLGEANDIHPKNKEDVGKRLGRLALKLAYDKDILAEGPRFDGMEIKGDQAVISFINTGKGLVAKDKYGYIRGFQIAGSDKKFYWAQASLVNDTIVVRSHQVKSPVAVRYAWSDNPGELDLYNSEGLPLVPFRTDNWKLSTEGEIFQDGPRF